MLTFEQSSFCGNKANTLTPIPWRLGRYTLLAIAEKSLNDYLMPENAVFFQNNNDK